MSLLVYGRFSVGRVNLHLTFWHYSGFGTNPGTSEKPCFRISNPSNSVPIAIGMTKQIFQIQPEADTSDSELAKQSRTGRRQTTFPLSLMPKLLVACVGGSFYLFSIIVLSKPFVKLFLIFFLCGTNNTRRLLNLV